MVLLFTKEKPRNLEKKGNMGHLVNPTGLRLGSKSYWQSTYPINLLSYPRYFNLVTQINLYLEYLFTTRSVDRLGLFLGHHVVSFKANLIFVDFFIYDGKFEEWVATLTKKILFRRRISSLAIADTAFLSAIFRSYLSKKFSRSSKIRSGNQFLKNKNYFNKFWQFVIAKYVSKGKFKKEIVIRFLLKAFGSLIYQKNIFGSLKIATLQSLQLFKNFNFQVRMFSIDNKNVTARFVSRFLTKKLLQRYRWASIVGLVRKDLTELMETWKLIKGYKIQFRGRFTRRSRSEAISINYGKISTSRIVSELDYATSNLVLKNGTGTIRVWIYRAKSFRLYSHRVC